MSNWIYELKQSRDGAKLVEAYKEVDETLQNSLGKDDDETDFIVYSEDNYSVSSGSVLLIKMSQVMIDYHFDNPKKDLLGFWSEKIVEEQYGLKNYKFRATANDLHNAFLTELSINGKRKSGELGKNAAEDVHNLFQGFSDWIRSFKFTREQYDPTLKSNKYLLKNYNKVFDVFDKGLDVVINSLQVFKDRLVTAKVFVRASEYFEGRFFDLMLQFIEAHITLFLRLKTFLHEVKKISNKGFAFLCGVINGLIEFLAGIADIIFVIIEGIVYGLFESKDEIGLDYLLLRESLENFAVKLIEEPDFLVKAIQKGIENYVDTRYYDEELTDYEIAYYAGEDIVIVVDVIVSLLTVVKGVAMFASKLSKLAEWLRSAAYNQYDRLRKLFKKKQQKPKRDNNKDEKEQQKQTEKENEQWINSNILVKGLKKNDDGTPQLDKNGKPKKSPQQKRFDELTDNGKKLFTEGLELSKVAKATIRKLNLKIKVNTSTIDFIDKDGNLFFRLYPFEYKGVNRRGKNVTVGNPKRLKAIVSKSNNTNKLFEFFAKTSAQRKQLINAANRKIVTIKPKPQFIRWYRKKVSAGRTDSKGQPYDIPISKRNKVAYDMLKENNVAMNCDFAGTNYLYKHNPIVKIRLTGDYTKDFDAAFEILKKDEGFIMEARKRGMSVDELVEQLKEKKEYTWHHLDDINERFTGTLQFVNRQAHKASQHHIGSGKQMRSVLGMETLYNSGGN